MSSETLVTYTCDRCLASTTVDGGDTPDGWVRLEMSSLWDAVRRSIGAPVDTRPRSLDICQRCIDNVILPTPQLACLDALYVRAQDGPVRWHGATATESANQDIQTVIDALSNRGVETLDHSLRTLANAAITLELADEAVAE
jgi:hypothetical protein